jgi:hypothetical protein
MEKAPENITNYSFVNTKISQNNQWPDGVENSEIIKTMRRQWDIPFAGEWLDEWMALLGAVPMSCSYMSCSYIWAVHTSRASRDESVTNTFFLTVKDCLNELYTGIKLSYNSTLKCHFGCLSKRDKSFVKQIIPVNRASPALYEQRLSMQGAM